MLRSVGVGTVTALMAFVGVARGDQPVKARQDTPRVQRQVVVQAVEAQPGGEVKIEVAPGGVKVHKGQGVIQVEPGDVQVFGFGEAPNAEGGKRLQRLLAAARPARISDYWIGLECYPAEGALRTQLELAEGQGLLIESVAEDSPAAKAGLEKHDVIVKAGGKPVGQVAELIEAVDKAKEKNLVLEVIRQARPKKIEVTPAKRPAQAQPLIPHLPMPVPGNPDAAAIKKWLEQVKPEPVPGGPMRFRFFQPGMILPPGARVHPPLPGNMSVAITRQGGEPAKIVVKKGDKKWEVTEKELDKLPEDIRPHVEHALGRIPLGGPAGLDVDVDVLKPTPDAATPPNTQFDKQLDRMNRQIEELRKAVEQMRGQDKKPAKPDKG